MQNIAVKNLSKEFKIGFRKRQSALEKFVSFFSGREPQKTIKVLENVSFDVNSSEVLGVIGPNGSGKSTLLRIIAGIYKKNTGQVLTRGKIVSLINLNAGLKERLTMRENIFLVGSLFGMSQKEIKKKFDSIVNFSGLEKFVDTKVYQFSNGMLQRLAFSIAIHSEPDILLLDEVFEVGDEEFRLKSAGKIKEVAKNGGSVILVSHDFEIIKKYCDRVIELENGRILREAKPMDIIL